LARGSKGNGNYWPYFSYYEDLLAFENEKKIFLRTIEKMRNPIFKYP
jgi:hypothetical protein